MPPIVSIERSAAIRLLANYQAIRRNHLNEIVDFEEVDVIISTIEDALKDSNDIVKITEELMCSIFRIRKTVKGMAPDGLG